MAIQNASCLTVSPSLLTGVLTDPAFGWPLYGLPLDCLAPVLVPVLSTPLCVFDWLDTTVSVGFFLSVIMTSALRWAFGLLHIQPLECVGSPVLIHDPSVLPWISSNEPFRWHPSYTPALFLSRQTPCFIGPCDIATKIIGIEVK
jgi:hypothetical protein